MIALIGVGLTVRLGGVALSGVDRGQLDHRPPSAAHLHRADLVDLVLMLNSYNVIGFKYF